MSRGNPRLYNSEARAEVLALIDKYLEHPDAIEGRRCVIPFRFGLKYYRVEVAIR